ncbi:phosphatidic acid phosphatase [Mycobacterium sp. 852002-51971_SCH5477799-a]|uniref:phosphatase PAP2 family protein n=1 Tax=Mycobacterium sp. 852002-51971_SCH5477799-a TaxID=1834106 RepID=UPI0007FC6ED1|nr:phosphatase PAP2 family protein [Mycobacterium sp. 852002-51971_SCH5477799-a]OBF65784.1 phosphatidic acid phosphatase [Mycobacterium sp. 852002-51971_SCH5477799-a]
MHQPPGPGAGGFGLVSAGAIAALVLLVWAAIWVARHGPRLRALIKRMSEVPATGEAMTWVRGRIGRLPTSEVAGIAMLLGLAVVVSLAVGFTEVLDDVLDGDGIAGIDRPITSWLAAHRDLWLTSTLRVVTHAGGPLLLAAFAFPISVAAAWRCRSWRPVVLVLVCGGGIPLVLFAAKALVGRERPPVPFALVDADGYSFPSGHATGTAATTVITAWLLTRWLIPWWTGRVVVWTVAIASVFLIGFSRVYLGVHYVSDVLAGWMLGIAWAGAVMLAGFWWDNARRAGPRQPDP